MKKKKGRGILGTLKDRFLSFGMVAAIGFLLLVSLAVSAGLQPRVDRPRSIKG